MVEAYFKEKNITVIPMPHKGTLYHKLEKSGASSLIKSSKVSSVQSPRAVKNKVEQQSLALDTNNSILSIQTQPASHLLAQDFVSPPILKSNTHAGNFYASDDSSG